MIRLRQVKVALNNRDKLINKYRVKKKSIGDVPCLLLFKEGKLTEAGKILADNNPMTTICCLVCDHEKQCEGNCVLGKKTAPVHFSMIEDYISSQYAQLVEYEKPEWNGKKVNGRIWIKVV